MERIFSLYFHFVGVGLLVTGIVAGSILNIQYKRAQDLKSKASILRTMKPIGLISPFASLIMLVTGIGNMHSLGYTVFALPGWLAYKIIFYVLAVISGVRFGMLARKRSALVGQMAGGSAPANADITLKGYDNQVLLSYIVVTILFLIILFLSIVGRLGIQ